jgi:biotin carboxyl carrier protein
MKQIDYWIEDALGKRGVLVSLKTNDEQRLYISVGEHTFEWQVAHLPSGVCRFSDEQGNWWGKCQDAGASQKISTEGSLQHLVIKRSHRNKLNALKNFSEHSIEPSLWTLKAPMPGRVVGIHVQEGERVQKGDVLCVLEAMKMENELRAECAGQIMRINIEAAQQVDLGAALLDINIV